LPGLRPREIVAALERLGFVVVRIVGSHYQMFNEHTRRHTSVPHHNRDLPRGTVSAILQQAGVTRGEFLRALQGLSVLRSPQ
jgi:predicted RNA binding protein YcfA (HicA-like mRNA interferase family)